jgi:starch-binding outer membrane protein, SusD/RagB family
VPNVGDNPNGYLRVNWLRSLSTTTTPTGPATYILYNWRGYSDNTGTKPVRYILPIHSSVISSSLGVLKNDGYGY